MEFKTILVVTDGILSDGTGSGVTLGNLFQGWDLNKFALYSVENDRLNGGILQGHDCFNKAINSQNCKYEKKLKNKGWLNYFKALVAKSGIRPYLTLIAPVVIKDQAVKDIKKLQPQIIFGPASDIYSIRRLLKIKKLTNARLGIIFFDDLIDRYDNLIFSRVYKWIHLKFLKYVISVARFTYVCSEAMREEYESIFGVKFYVISNPVDLEKVRAYRPVTPRSMPLKIVYAGTVNSKNISNLKMMSEAVKYLADCGHSVFLDIYTFATKLEFVQSQFQEFGNNVEVRLAPIEDHELFAILGQASILYIPMDFTDESIKSIRLSYLTKQPLYMALGVPLIVHGPLSIHVVEHALKHRYAEVITDKSVDVLAKNILRHIEDYNGFIKATEFGLEYARNFHSINKVQLKFYERLLLN